MLPLKLTCWFKRKKKKADQGLSPLLGQRLSRLHVLVSGVALDDPEIVVGGVAAVTWGAEARDAAGRPECTGQPLTVEPPGPKLPCQGREPLQWGLDMTSSAGPF